MKQRKTVGMEMVEKWLKAKQRNGEVGIISVMDTPKNREWIKQLKKGKK